MSPRDGAGDRTVSPKDAFITVYGRRPVLEALTDPGLRVDKVVLAEGLRDASVKPVLDAAADRGVPVQRASAQRVKVLAGNGRQDQGVLADVVAPRMRPLEHYLDDLPTDATARVLVLDALTNPVNVGMILRSATAAGLDGILLPRRGVPAIDPLVIKASAGVAFAAPVLRAGTAASAVGALAAAGFAVFGLAGDASTSLFELSVTLPERIALVVGGETDGLTEAVRNELHGTVAIPMAEGVESLNAACAATLACFELTRRERSPSN